MGKESIELLLNYKENGEPFWNLLYCGEFRKHVQGDVNMTDNDQRLCTVSVARLSSSWVARSTAPQPSIQMLIS